MQVSNNGILVSLNYVPAVNLIRASKQGGRQTRCALSRSKSSASHSLQPCSTISKTPPRPVEYHSWRHHSRDISCHVGKAIFSTSTEERVLDDVQNEFFSGKPPLQLESHWNKVTERLLETSIPFWDENSFHQARQALYWWTRQKQEGSSVLGDSGKPSIEAIESCWKIVERYFNELQSFHDKHNLKDDTRKSLAIPEDLFKLFVNKWRKFMIQVAIEREGPFAIPTPMEMIPKLDEFRSKGLVTNMNAEPYNMVFNAMTYYYKDATKLVSDVSDQVTYPFAGEVPRSNIAEQAEEILNRMINESHSNSSSNSTAVSIMPIPDIVTFASVMKLWILEGGQHRQSRLTRRRELEEAAHHVNSLEEKRRTLYQKLNRPDFLEQSSIYKSIMIDAWAQAGIADRAEAMLEEWCQKCSKVDISDNETATGADAVRPSQADAVETKGMICEPPTMRVFASVLSAWSNSGHPKAAKHADAILKVMIELYENGRDGKAEDARFSFQLDEPPSIVAYSTVLGCFAKSGGHNAAERAESILRYLQEKKHLDINAFTYTTVIHAWAKRGDTERALSLLREMVNREEGSLAPDISTFNSLLLSMKSPKQALDVLDKMHQLADEHPTWTCRPDVVSYTTVMQILGKAGLPDAARKLLDEMVDYHSSSNAIDSTAHLRPLPKPDTQTYNIVLHAYSKLGRAEEATSLLKEMYDAYSLYYDSGSHSAGWPTSPNKAELPTSIKHEEETTNPPSIIPPTPPDVISFNSALSSWSRSVDTISSCTLQEAYYAAEKAEQIFAFMEQEMDVERVSTQVPGASSTSSSALKLDIRPNVTTYTTIMGCWSNVAAAQRESSRRGDLAESAVIAEDEIVTRCEALFEKMEDSYNDFLNQKPVSGNSPIGDLKPNIAAFSNLFNVYASFGYHGSRLQEPLRQMRDQYFVSPNAQWYVGLFNSWSRYCETDTRKLRDASKEHEKILLQAEEMISEELSKITLQHQQRRQKLSQTVNLIVFNTMLKLLKASKTQDKISHVNRVLGLMDEAGIHPNRNMQRLVELILQSENH